LGDALCDLGAKINLMSLATFKKIEGLMLIPDRSLASAPNTIEVVKISIPRGLFLIAIS